MKSRIIPVILFFFIALPMGGDIIFSGRKAYIILTRSMKDENVAVWQGKGDYAVRRGDEKAIAIYFPGERPNPQFLKETAGLSQDEVDGIAREKGVAFWTSPDGKSLLIAAAGLKKCGTRCRPMRNCGAC